MKTYKFGLKVMALGVKIGVLGALGGMVADISSAGMTAGLGTLIGSVVGGVIGGTVFLLGAGIVCCNAYKRCRPSNILNTPQEESGKSKKKIQKEISPQHKVSTMNPNQQTPSQSLNFGYITNRVNRTANNTAQTAANRLIGSIQKRF